MSITQSPCKSPLYLLNQTNSDTNPPSKITLYIPSVKLQLSAHSNKSSLSAHSSSSDRNLTEHSVSTRTTTPAPTIADNTSHSHRNTNPINPLQLLQKRVLFVSIIQLYRSYRNIPSFILENSLFTFAIKRSWIFPETQKERNEANTTYIHHFVCNWSQDFIQIIKKKDEKGHILWIQPCNHDNPQLYWTTISNKLCQIVDLSVSKITNVTINTDISNVSGVIENKSRPSASNICHRDCNASPFSISEQILSPTACLNEFTFTNYSDDEDAVVTDSDFEQEQKVETDTSATDMFADKSRASQRDLLDSEYYLPLKLDRNWWLQQYESEVKSMFNVKSEDIIKQIDCMDHMNKLQFVALKELFYQSNHTLIPMECFDVKMYIDAHLEDRNKYNDVLVYCNHEMHKYKDGNMNDGSEIAFVACYSEHSDMMQPKSSTSMMSAESNSMLPFGGKILCDDSQEIRLFDSDTNKQKVNVFVNDEEVNHLEYYLSNTIVSSSRKDGTFSDFSNDNLNVDNDKKTSNKKKRKTTKKKHKGSEWKYEVPSKCIYRAKGNIFICREMTKHIIPNRIKENFCNLWQFIDKSNVMLKDIFYTKKMQHNKKIKIVYYDFHDKVKNDKLYCVLDENKDKIKTNYRWKMRNTLLSADEIEIEFGIKGDELPKSVRESREWKSSILNENKIKNIILNEDKMADIINKTKWHKIAIQNKQHSKRRMTLSMNKEEFIKHLHSIKRTSKEEIHLVPIIMFKPDKYRMEYVWIIEIDININIGISMIYKDDVDNIEICDIHLDKTYISNQYELISRGLNRLQCLEDFTSSITNLHIGNPDDLMNRIKDLLKRNNDLKKDKDSLNEELMKVKSKYQQLLAHYNAK